MFLNTFNIFLTSNIMFRNMSKINSNNNITMNNNPIVSNLQNNIDELMITDYLDDIDNYSKLDVNTITDEKDIIVKSIIKENENKTMTEVKYNEDIFFNCFDEEILINNAIACDSISSSESLDDKNKIVTSYVFDNEDIRHNDIYPFEDEIYNVDKVKSNKSIIDRLGFIFSTTLNNN